MNHLSVVSSSLFLGPKGRRSGPRKSHACISVDALFFHTPVFPTPKIQGIQKQHQMQFREKFSDVQTFGFGKLEDDPGSQRL